MMKNLLFCLLFAVSCTQNPAADATWFSDNGKVKVLSTIAMIDDLVTQIGGDRIDSTALVRGELDPHSYELVKGDDEKFARADIVFYNGLGLEHGPSLRHQIAQAPYSVAVSQSIDRAQIVQVDGQDDPHIWMDIGLWVQTVEPIVETLCAYDPAHAQEYRTRGEALVAQMKQADAAIFARLQAIPSSKRYLVTSHDAFNYFTRHYLADPGEAGWQVRCAAPEGLAPEAQMSVRDVLAIMSHVEEFGVTVLFPESNVSKDALKKIVSAATNRGHPLRLCHETLYGDAMGDVSYLEMIEHNVNVIATELVR